MVEVSPPIFNYVSNIDMLCLENRMFENISLTFRRAIKKVKVLSDEHSNMECEILQSAQDLDSDD